MAYRSQKVRVMLGLTRNCPHYSLLGLSIPQASKRTHCISGTIALTAELAQSISILNLRILTTWLIWITWSSNVRKAEINTSTLCNIVAECLAHRKTQWIWKEDTSSAIWAFDAHGKARALSRRLKSGQQLLAVDRENFMFFSVLLTGCGSERRGRC